MNRAQIKEALDLGSRAGGGAASLFMEARLPEMRQKIEAIPQYRAMLAAMAAEAEEYLSSPIKALPYSFFKLFAETGSRREYEQVYFDRRARLCYLALLSLLESGSKYLGALEDTIWAICDEYTWCLPAHLHNTCPVDEGGLEDQEKALDLFATETAFTLAEILSLLGEASRPQISPMVAARAKREIHRRVLGPYDRLLQPLWWESAAMNWAAVCAGSVGAAAMYLIEDHDRLAGILHRVLGTMDSYLRGFGADGATTEGIGYWSYGFGFFTYFAALLRQRTAGRIDLFRGEKIEQIALFPQKCYLTGNQVVSFSDAPLYAYYLPGLMAYLQKEFPEVRTPAPRFRVDLSHTRQRSWAELSRGFFWGPPEKEGGLPAEASYYLPDAQWLIARASRGEKQICFAAKGGHNDEPHNHNDLGSFILHVNGDTLLADPGRGVYTRQYFGAERYLFFCNGSQGHSVPIIDGCFQQAGREHAAKILDCLTTAARDVFVLDLAGAYGGDNLKRLARRWEFNKAPAPSLVLEDSFVFARAPASVTERFISWFAPAVLAEGEISLRGENGGLVMRYDPAVLRPVLQRESFTTHEGEDKTIHVIDLMMIRRSAEFGVKIEFLID